MSHSLHFRDMACARLATVTRAPFPLSNVRLAHLLAGTLPDPDEKRGPLTSFGLLATSGEAAILSRIEGLIQDRELVENMRRGFPVLQRVTTELGLHEMDILDAEDPNPIREREYQTALAADRSQRPAGRDHVDEWYERWKPDVDRELDPFLNAALVNELRVFWEPLARRGALCRRRAGGHQ